MWGNIFGENTASLTVLRVGVCVQLCHVVVCYRILIWPLRRDDLSGVLIGEGGARRSDWPARV